MNAMDCNTLTEFDGANALQSYKSSSVVCASSNGFHVVVKCDGRTLTLESRLRKRLDLHVNVAVSRTSLPLINHVKGVQSNNLSDFIVPTEFYRDFAQTRISSLPIYPTPGSV